MRRRQESTAEVLGRAQSEGGSKGETDGTEQALEYSTTWMTHNLRGEEIQDTDDEDRNVKMGKCESGCSANTLFQSKASGSFRW